MSLNCAKKDILVNTVLYRFPQKVTSPSHIEHLTEEVLMDIRLGKNI